MVTWWANNTPKIPGNSVPGLDHTTQHAPDSVLQGLYKDLYGVAPSTQYTRADLADKLVTINTEILAADARCQAARSTK